MSGIDHLNPYRLAGDISHVLAILTLLWKFGYTKSSHGVSGKTQVLLAATYTLRYMDLWGEWIWISYYNTAFKLFYIGASFLIVYLTYSTYKQTFDWDADSFKIELLILPVTILAYLINHDITISEIAWTWSIYMEAVALIPQLFMIWKTGKTESYIIMYLFYMGAYRGMYIFNWVYRYQTEGYYDAIASTSGIIETFVGIFGVLCVVSQQLSRKVEASFVKKSGDSVYVIPSVADAKKAEAEASEKKWKATSNFYLPV